MAEAQSARPQVTYGELIRLFVRLSVTAFGGPVAHIALAEEEVVNRRQWLTRDHFLDLIAATNLIPGPNSTEMMIHIGYVMRGIPGAIVTGACFIIPAFLITLVLSVLYVSTGSLPQANALFWGIKPVIVAVIASAGYRLMQSALKSRDLQVLFVVSTLALALWNPSEVLVMLAAGALYALYRTQRPLGAAALLGLGWPQMPQFMQMAANPSLLEIFGYFLRIGAVLFGSGYVLVAYIQQDVVNTFGWLNAQQLLDAVAIGQTTPGPVLTTVTAVGYIVSGLPGAVIGTLGVFLPSVVFVILSAPLIPRMRRSRFMGAFLSGINAAVIAAILITLIDLAQIAALTLDGTQISPLAVALVALSLLALLRLKVNATWLIAAGGLIGLLAGSLGLA